MYIERESTRTPSLENSLWKSLWARRKTDYKMKDFISLSIPTNSDILS